MSKLNSNFNGPNGQQPLIPYGQLLFLTAKIPNLERLIAQLQVELAKAKRIVVSFGNPLNPQGINGKVLAADKARPTINLGLAFNHRLPRDSRLIEVSPMRILSLLTSKREETRLFKVGNWLLILVNALRRELKRNMSNGIARSQQ
ncbi:MAG: hypothetical protein KDJ52_08575 [Anaerolineae bacterium]|nr:hypothetical protein [Anaerolineae bacterium]